MATTSIVDSIEPALWLPYMFEQTKEKSALFQSGIVQEQERISNLASQGGTTFNIPHWNDLTGSSQPGDVDIVPNKVTSDQMIGVKNFRNQAWSDDDIVSMVAGDDPGRAIARGVADYWQREIQDYLIYMLKGLFGSSGPLNGSHVYDVATADGVASSDVKIQPKHLVQAIQSALGDSRRDITGMAVHSKVYADMAEQNLVSERTNQEQNVDFSEYLGLTVVEDDNVPVNLGTDATDDHDVYSNYLFGPGAVGYGEGQPDNPVEAERDGLTNGGQDVLISRRSWVAHPQGIKWTGAGTGITGGDNNITPTQADLEDGNNYAKAFDDKNIPLIELKTN